jgi:hypothetical protein
LHRTVSHVFVSYGSYEVLADPIKDSEMQMQKGWSGSGEELSRVVFLEGSKEAHIVPIVDIITPGAKIKSASQHVIKNWYRARLKCDARA